jgi:DNA-directed RNA polymerase subunit RPC12/RpoP
MIAFDCAHCGRKLQVPDEQAGKQAKCPGCGQLTAIPQPAAAVP